MRPPSPACCRRCAWTSSQRHRRRAGRNARWSRSSSFRESRSRSTAGGGATTSCSMERCSRPPAVRQPVRHPARHVPIPPGRRAVRCALCGGAASSSVAASGRHAAPVEKSARACHRARRTLWLRRAARLFLTVFPIGTQQQVLSRYCTYKVRAASSHELISGTSCMVLLAERPGGGG